MAVRCKKSNSKIAFIAEGNRNKCNNTNYWLEKERALIVVGVVN
jgi:hypothetical protein